jgi:ABC-type multidrug transport system fused ATPase/permease subunit
VKKDISYYDKNKTGELISRLTSDVSTVEGAASDNISILLRNLIQFFGSLVFLYVISWQLTTFIIIVTPIISFAIIAIIRISKRLKK